MVMVPSIGDILMMSTMAWKVGRAFTKGMKGAPAEFAEVEREANSLSEALKLVGETLCDDDGNSLLSRADSTTQTAFGLILASAERTLSDLESFVLRYQVVKKTETGFVVERTWTNAVLRTYRTCTWTTEGGTIRDLRDMLSLHANSINLTLQALQSKSLMKLERTVLPMAETVAAMHDQLSGDLSVKIDEIHKLITALATVSPNLNGSELASRGQSRCSSLARMDSKPVNDQRSPTEQRQSAASVASLTLPDPLPMNTSTDTTDTSVSREDSAYFSSFSPKLTEGNAHRDWRFETGSPSSRRSSIGARFDGGSVMDEMDDELAQDESSSARRESTTLSNMTPLPLRTTSTRWEHDTSLRRTSTTLQDTRSASITSRATVPQRQGSPPTSSGAPNPTFSPQRKHARSVSTVVSSSQGKAFEQCLFRNSAILCDVRVSLLEYAQYLPDEPDARFNTEMLEVCRDARVYVVRRSEPRLNGSRKTSTAIWTISDDGKVRCRQKLPNIAETIPYCSYFQPEKVAIPPKEGEMRLRLCGEKWDDEPEREWTSTWINYVFVSEEDAAAFQSALYGRRLLQSFHTTKTTVIHGGRFGAFAFEEQMSKIEMLRIWEEDGTVTAGAGGGVLALIHVSSTFGDGFAKFWLNNSRQQVRARDDGGRFVKIKGLDLRVAPPIGRPISSTEIAHLRPNGGGSSSQLPERRVGGIRIEFKTEEEKNLFLTVVKSVQERMFALPID